MEKLKLDKTTLKKFGITMGMAFLIITLFILIRHKHAALSTSIISIMFFISALAMPVLLKPVYLLWMRLAYILSWINTRLILFIMFYIVFTPIGIGMRLFGADLLDRKIARDKGSYWLRKEKRDFNPVDYERQF